MVKAKKTAENNQWQSVNPSQFESCAHCNSKKEEKTATDNQWASTKTN